MLLKCYIIIMNSRRKKMKIENKIQALNDNELEDIIGGATGKTIARRAIKGVSIVVGMIGGGLVAFALGTGAGYHLSQSFTYRTYSEELGHNVEEHTGLGNAIIIGSKGTATAVGIAGGSLVGDRFADMLIKWFNLEEKRNR